MKIQENKFVLSKSLGVVNNHLQNIYDYKKQIQELKNKISNELDSISRTSLLQSGNLVEAVDILTNTKSNYVCLEVISEVSKEGEIEFHYTFIRMRKNSKQKFLDKTYSDDELKDILIIDQSKNWLVNNDDLF